MNNEGTAGIPLRFSLSNRALKFRDILNKNFIELEVWAISDINPNRNKSHFTVESLEKAVERGEFFNKPIVGFFEKNDFTTHEGRASYDPEVDKTYWDTTKGERILGWVRSQDKVELVEDADGLHWVKFTCILYTRYCYQQVKRLLKDRHKDVSVEITVHDSDMVDDIRYIKDFTLEGVAILGSKNGKTVMPGIPDAHLTVLDTEGNEELAAQYKELAFAYESMDSDGVQDKQNGEGETPLVPDDL